MYEFSEVRFSCDGDFLKILRFEDKFKHIYISIYWTIKKENCCLSHDPNYFRKPLYEIENDNKMCNKLNILDNIDK